jgi:hypothetical protein
MGGDIPEQGGVKRRPMVQDTMTALSDTPQNSGTTA